MDLSNSEQLRQIAEMEFDAGDQMIRSGIFQDASDPLFRAAVTQLLVQLATLEQIARREGLALSRCEGFPGPDDLHDLIRHCRDAACQFTGSEFSIESGYLPWTAYWGIDDVEVEFGSRRILIRGQAIWAWNAVRDHFGLNLRGPQ